MEPMKVRGMRADARRNRASGSWLLPGDAFVDQGPDAPLDAIAAAAEVGIGTLYRRFPDRWAVIRAVVLDVLARTAEEARLALAEEADAFRALARYMHRALDLRVSAVMPCCTSTTCRRTTRKSHRSVRARGDCSNSWSTGRTPPGYSARM